VQPVLEASRADTALRPRNDGRTPDVGGEALNTWGLFDVLGNVLGRSEYFLSCVAPLPGRTPEVPDRNRPIRRDPFIQEDPTVDVAVPGGTTPPTPRL